MCLISFAFRRHSLAVLAVAKDSENLKLKVMRWLRERNFKDTTTYNDFVKKRDLIGQGVFHVALASFNIVGDLKSVTRAWFYGFTLCMAPIVLQVLVVPVLGDGSESCLFVL